MKTLLIALVVTMAICAQTSNELKRKYGNPVSETFKVNDGIGVKVKLGPHGAIAEMLILPIRTDALVESREFTFTEEAAKRMLDQLVPTSRRGKFIIAGFVNAICFPDNDCAGSEENYEKVSIFYNSARTSGQLCYVDIRFKK